MSGKRVTMAQVASEAGVAASTASLVLSGRGTEMRISAAVQQRVQDTAKRLGYRPNAVSVGLRTGTSSTLGFVSDSVASSRLAGEMIKGAIEAASDRGFMVFVGETGGNNSLERQLLDAMFDRQVDGVVLGSMRTHERDVPEQLNRTPAVLLNIGAAKPTTLPTVVPDEYQAGRRAASLVLEAGHRDIHLLGAGPGRADFPPTALGGQLRLAGILDVFEESGIAPSSGQNVPAWLPPEGWRLTKNVLKQGTPGAIICFNDRLAMGAYQALNEAGLTVPDDVSVVSFDDATIASWLRPGLTTYALPHRAMGRRAIDLLIDQIDKRRVGADPSTEPVAPPGGVHLVEMPLRERESLRRAGN